MKIRAISDTRTEQIKKIALDNPGYTWGNYDVLSLIKKIEELKSTIECFEYERLEDENY